MTEVWTFADMTTGEVDFQMVRHVQELSQRWLTCPETNSIFSCDLVRLIGDWQGSPIGLLYKTQGGDSLPLHCQGVLIFPFKALKWNLTGHLKTNEQGPITRQCVLYLLLLLYTELECPFLFSFPFQNISGQMY